MRPIQRWGAFVAAVLAASLARAGDAPAPVDFNRDVRPLLSETCFQCHGPDKNKRKADLRLDTKAGVLQNVEPGKLDESELYQRLITDDLDDRMPPPQSGRSLTPRQIGTIKQWIEQGAAWRGHWAYIPPVRPAVPGVAAAANLKNEIDRFLQEKRAERGLSPAPEADRATLIRRLSFDLTGLPPTPEEIAAFVNDQAADAYERLVDRLLASPHFGERMAIDWLDLVRYADSAGYHSDNPREVSLYRDYVINVFNDNKRFDKFTIEQLAGDLLPDPTDEQKVASGYNRLLQTTEEGGAQAKEYMAKYAADRVRNVSSVWLASTLGCSECHDHKFDPFLTREFYGFEAFFADVKEAAVGRQEPVKVPTPEQAARARDLEARIATVQKTLGTPTAELAAAQARWETMPRVTWEALKPTEAHSQHGATLTVLDDGSILASGTNPDSDSYVLTFPSIAGVTALRLEVLPDGSLPAKGPGRADNGNFVLNRLEAAAAGQPLAWGNVTATHAQDNWAVAGAVDGAPASGWAILPQTGRANEALFETKNDLNGAFTIVLDMNYGTRHTLGHFRVSTTIAPRPIVLPGPKGLPQPIVDVLAVAPESRTEAQKQQLAAYYRTIAPLLEPARRELADLEKQQEALRNEMPATLITQAVAPRTMRVLPRGNWLDDSGPEVAPTVPSALGSLGISDRRPTRLDLARWLVAPENPLVARVFVNRLWKLAFGQGIVTTLDDFGSQGAWPTHPHLLDWLAVEFIESGWDVKLMLRRIVLSEAYRQSSVATESLRQRDPSNSWLARQGRYRLEAETVRDNALAISGLLVRRVGGPSVKPYQPAGYWAHLNFPRRDYVDDHGPNEYRRGLYTWWQRSFLHPSLLAFDASTREECTVQRPRSNTPLQALVLLNDPTYVEAARAFGERIVREGGQDVAPRIQRAYLLALGRAARPAEVELLGKLVQRHLDEFRADKAAAVEFLRVGDRPAASDLDPVELAAWTSVARVILNLHETITRN